jgi:hypothetical protein
MPPDWFEGGTGPSTGQFSGVNPDFGQRTQAGKNYGVTMDYSNCDSVIFDGGEAGNTDDDFTGTGGASAAFQVKYKERGSYTWTASCVKNGAVVDTISGSVDVAEGDDARDEGILDGLGACVPNGWQILNPVAYVKGTGCVLHWAFVPDVSSISADMADLKNGADGAIPFSWASAANSSIQSYVSGMFSVSSDSTRSDQCRTGFLWSNNPVTEAIPLNSCTGGSEGISNWIRSALAGLIWMMVGYRIWHSAPWIKGQDTGMPG